MTSLSAQLLLQLYAPADHLRREFVWAALLPPSLFLRPETAEIAAGFSLSVANAHRFNVQFHDPMAQERVDAVTDIVRAAYLGFLQNNKIWLRDIPLQERWVLYERFGREVAAVADARTSLDRIFYWEPGRYTNCIDHAAFEELSIRANLQHFRAEHRRAPQQRQRDRGFALRGAGFCIGTSLRCAGRRTGEHRGLTLSRVREPL